jgi:hypothetical protein
MGFAASLGYYALSGLGASGLKAPKGRNTSTMAEGHRSSVSVTQLTQRILPREGNDGLRRIVRIYRPFRAWRTLSPEGA